MQEMSTQSEQVPILLPGASKRLTALSQAPPAPPLQSEVHRFVDLVICDGRYLNEVTTTPRLAADALGFDLSAEAEAELRAQPLQRHVAGLYAVKFEGAIHVAIIIIIAAIIIIIAIAISRYSKESRAMVRDLSPRGNLKL
jgi:hypothetical protein